MSQSQILALMPIIMLSLTSVILMLQASVKRSPKVAFFITALGMLATIWALGFACGFTQQVTPLLVVDEWGLFFSLLVLIAALVTLVLSGRLCLQHDTRKEEYYLLLTLSVLGAVVLVQSSHMASLLLGMELMGVALYGMIAFPEKSLLSLEAAIKYLVMSACASAMLLFGFALLYAATGNLTYEGIGVNANLAWQGNTVLISAGTALVVAGLGFKLSVVPFHMWTPDVYQGAPTPVAGFLATVSKGAVFVALTRLFLDAHLNQYANLVAVLTVVAIASMLVGNLLALQQVNLKRLLGYSSIAHFGYLLVILIAATGKGALARDAITFYLAAYMTTTLVAFSVAAMVAGDNDDGYSLSHFSGLFWQRPLQATALTVAMLSLAGIPLTAGFMGKFYVINAGIGASLWLLLAVLLIGSAIAIYYYLRVIFVMSSPVCNTLEKQPFRGHEIMALILLLLVLILGTWPQPFIEFITALS